MEYSTVRTGRIWACIPAGRRDFPEGLLGADFDKREREKRTWGGFCNPCQYWNIGGEPKQALYEGICQFSVQQNRSNGSALQFLRLLKSKLQQVVCWKGCLCAMSCFSQEVALTIYSIPLNIGKLAQDGSARAAEGEMRISL